MWGLGGEGNWPTWVCEGTSYPLKGFGLETKSLEAVEVIYCWDEMAVLMGVWLC